MLRDDTYEVEFPMCACGMPYKKMTRLITSFPPLGSLQGHCHHVKHKTQLCGKIQVVDREGVRHYVNRTELAGASPQSLAETWASLLEPLLHPCHVETIDSPADRTLEHSLEQEHPFVSHHL